jgi:hypothetical protein
MVVRLSLLKSSVGAKIFAGSDFNPGKKIRKDLPSALSAYAGQSRFSVSVKRWRQTIETKETTETK